SEILDAFPGINRLGLSGTRSTDSQIVVKAADFIADFCDKARAVHIERDVVGHIYVAGMIDKSPAGTINHGAADNRGRVAIVQGARAMEVNRVTGTRVGTGAGLQSPITLHHGVVNWFRLIGSAKPIESGISDMDVVVVHEHNVAEAVNGCSL